MPSKPRFLCRAVLAAALLAGGGALAGCGQTGPLYLPPKPKPKPAAPVSVPAPQTAPTPSTASR